MIKAVVFDRDATLNKTTQILRAGQQPGDPTDGYVLAPDELELFPAVRPALALLRTWGITPFVFTQQNCIGKGLVTEAEVAAIHEHMNNLLGPAARIEKFYLAWNVQGEGESPRAKPSPAMLHEIMADYGLKPEEMIVVGDSMRDYKSAMAAGVIFAWVRDDLRRVSEKDMQATGCPVYDDVEAFAKDIVAAPHPRQAHQPQP